MNSIREQLVKIAPPSISRNFLLDPTPNQQNRWVYRIILKTNKRSKLQMISSKKGNPKNLAEKKCFNYVPESSAGSDLVEMSLTSSGRRNQS